MIRTLAYISTYTGEKDQILQDLTDICQTSKAANPVNGITGVLFYHNRRFLQLIEGSKANIYSLMENIRADHRHNQIEVMVDVDTQTRGFPSWNMDTFHLNASQQIDASLVAKVSDLFSLSPKVNGKHFIWAVQDILKHWQTKTFSIL